MSDALVPWLQRCRRLAPHAALLGLLLAAACTPSPAIGGPCDPVAPAANLNTTTVNAPALECAGRTCVQMNGGQAFCSAECSQPEDCQEISPGGTTCRGGFTCAVAVQAGPYACRRFCVCRDGADTALSCPTPP
jgi:hypothetical protein